MAASTTLNTILRGSLRSHLTGERNCVHPGDDGAFAGRTAYFGARFTASSKLAFADPGRSGFGWLSWGAQPDSQITS